MMFLDEYNSIQETAYLLRSPANAERLLESIADMRKGNVAPHPLAMPENDGWRNPSGFRTPGTRKRTP